MIDINLYKSHHSTNAMYYINCTYDISTYSRLFIITKIKHKKFNLINKNNYCSLLKLL